MTASPDDQEPDTSAAAVINRLGRGLLLAMLLVAAVRVLTIGPEEAMQRLSVGIRAIMSV